MYASYGLSTPALLHHHHHHHDPPPPPLSLTPVSSHGIKGLLEQVILVHADRHLLLARAHWILHEEDQLHHVSL